MSSTGKDGERGRDVLGALRVDQDLGLAADVQPEHAVGLRHRNAEGLAVELLRGRDVVHGEAAEGLRSLEHGSNLLVAADNQGEE
jgi:hypothetical protein